MGTSIDANMSGNSANLALKEEDVTKMLAATTHIGSTNTDFQMEQYIFKRRSDGVHIINIRRTYEKLLLAARAIVAIDNPADVFVISSRPEGQRAALKFASYTKSTPIAGRFTPCSFTNQIQAAFREPMLLIINPLLKPVTSTSPSLLWPTLIRPCVTLILPFPATTRLPTRLVRCSTCWPVKCSVFVASSLAIWNGASWPTCSSTWALDIEKEEKDKLEQAQAAVPVKAAAEEYVQENWTEPAVESTNWADEAPAPVAAPAAPFTVAAGEDWASAPADDWSTPAAPATGEWGAPTTTNWA